MTNGKALLRLMSKTLKNGGCLEYTGGISSTGYGVFWLNGKSVNAHKASYLLNNGTEIGDLWVLHTCDNKKCINPLHLYLGDRNQNTIDAVERCRMARGIFHGSKTNVIDYSNHPSKKISNEECILIRDLISKGRFTVKQVANNRSVHLSTAYRALYRADALINELNK